MASSNEVKKYLKYAEVANSAYAFELIYSHDNNDQYFGDLEKVLIDKRDFFETQAKEFVYDKDLKTGYNYKFQESGKEQAKTSYEYFQNEGKKPEPNGFKAAILKEEKKGTERKRGQATLFCNVYKSLHVKDEKCHE